MSPRRAEAVVLTEGNDLPCNGFFDVILGTLFGSRSYKVYSAAAGRMLPMLSAVHARVRDPVDAGHGDATGLRRLALRSTSARWADGRFPAKSQTSDMQQWARCVQGASRPEPRSGVL